MLIFRLRNKDGETLYHHEICALFSSLRTPASPFYVDIVTNQKLPSQYHQSRDEQMRLISLRGNYLPSSLLSLSSSCPIANLNGATRVGTVYSSMSRSPESHLEAYGEPPYNFALYSTIAPWLLIAPLPHHPMFTNH